MTLGKNQKAVLDALLSHEMTILKIADVTKLQEYKVKNILMELYDAGLVRRSEQGIYRIVDRIPAPKTSGEKCEWEEYQQDYIPKLKNLSRVV